MENNRVEFQPTMINLTKVVNIVSKELITTIKVVPRMREVVLQGANGTREIPVLLDKYKPIW
jgi:hypothetical protein